jgi:L-lactate dehydrogenase complex protein LldE
MKTALFIPCYIDQFYPEVGKASLMLLESLGCQVEYPMQQTCCGQPMANTGMEKEAIPVYHHFVSTFSNYDYVVAPSGSCVYHVKHHYDIIQQTEEVEKIRTSTLDIATFLLEVLHVKELPVQFPHRVGIHQSCHGLRGLKMARPSELMISPHSQWRTLLEMVAGIEIVDLNRPDECCGFGGTFSINEEAVSVKMGKDRILDHQQNGVEYITAGDMSCLMHLEGIIRKEKLNMKVKHLVEILAGV